MNLPRDIVEGVNDALKKGAMSAMIWISPPKKVLDV